MPDSPDVVVRLAEDCELERVVQLRWVWEAETDDEPGDRESFVTAAAAWARAHRETHIAHIAVTARGTVWVWRGLLSPRG